MPISIKAKLLFAGLISCLAVLVLALVNMYSANQGTKALFSVYEGQVAPSSALNEMERTLKEVSFRLSGVLLDQVSPNGSLNHLGEARKTIPQQWLLFRDRVQHDVTDKEIQESIARIDKQVAALPDFFDKLEAGYKNDDRDALATLLEDEWPIFQANILNPAARLIAYQQSTVKAAYEAGRVRGERQVYTGMALFAVSLLVVAATLFFTTHSIVRPLGKAIALAETIAEGNLDAHIDQVASGDEIGQLMRALKGMNEGLVTVVGRIRTGTDSITTASREIAAGNADLSTRTEAQASSLEETASSIEELTSTVKQNADNARLASQLVGEAANVAERGGRVVNEVVETMTSIDQDSHRISEIVSVIDGIAFQTNILALNAAVEAARAGEQGRGFAVVAAEVRNLAQRSATAAKEIKTLIENTVAKVAAGSQQAADAGKTMEEIVAAVQKAASSMNEIAAASREQSAGIEQVNQAVGQMDQMTQQNAALVEEAAAAAESLQDQAAKLADAVSFFQTGHARPSGGSKPHPRQPASRPAPAPRARTTLSTPQMAAACGGNDEWETF